MLSFIFGTSENTISPNQLSDVLVDLTCLRYFHAYCVHNAESPAAVASKGLSLATIFSRSASRKSYNTASVALKSNEPYDNLLFFWFDVMRFKQLVIESQSGKSPNTTNTTSEPSEQHSPMIKKDICTVIRSAQDICSTYLSESGVLALSPEILSNRERNEIRTYVLDLVAHYLPNEEGYSSGYDYEVSTAYSINEMEQFKGVRKNSGPKLEEKSSESSDSDASDKESEMDDNDVENRLVALFSKPAKAASDKLEGLMATFKESDLYSELIHVLRMKAVGKQRSLYRDIVQSVLNVCCSKFRSVETSSSKISANVYIFVRREKEKKRRNSTVLN